MTSRPWQPLLDAGNTRLAWAAIDDIAATLSVLPHDRLRHAGLAGGSSGLALFFAYLASAQDGRGHDDTAARLLEWAHEDTATAPPHPSLFSGFSGVAWATQHVSGEPQEAAIESLAVLLERPSWPGHWELVDGLAGFGVYALAALTDGAQPDAARVLARIVDHLLAALEPAPPGVRLWSRPALLWAPTRVEYPQGYENLGVSHGAPGPMAVLAQAATSGALEPGLAAAARAAAGGLAARLISLALPGPARYPAWVAPGKERTGSRLAWCYGDLGIACALLVTARALDDAALEGHAIDTARLAAARSIADAGVHDAGLCHGSIGNALLLARLAHECDDVALADAARRYFADGLARRRHGDGTAGFLAHLPGGDAPDVSFLTGAAGIGLGLLAAVTEIEPTWDVVLAASPALPH